MPYIADSYDVLYEITGYFTDDPETKLVAFIILGSLFMLLLFIGVVLGELRKKSQKIMLLSR
jgi:uncharacterized membrane protein (UPF0136 family)